MTASSYERGKQLLFSAQEPAPDRYAVVFFHRGSDHPEWGANWYGASPREMRAMVKLLRCMAKDISKAVKAKQDQTQWRVSNVGGEILGQFKIRDEANEFASQTENEFDIEVNVREVYVDTGEPV